MNIRKNLHRLHQAFASSLALFALLALGSAAFGQTFTTNNLVVNGTFTGNGANALGRTVANVAALRANACVPGSVYTTQGYYAAGDLGGFSYVCNGADTTTPDNGCSVIASAGAGYRLKAQLATPLSTRVCGAKIDGATDDTTAITNAAATGYALFFPSGTSLTTASIPGLHAARKSGPGKISRSGNVFAVSPSSSDTNKLFVSTAGNNSNDGLSASQPQLTVQASIDVLSNYGPVLNGVWQINLAAGTYTNGAQFPAGLQSKSLIQIQGPTGTLPFVPTAIISGASSPTTNYGLYLAGGNSVLVQNIYFQNWQSAGNDFCVAGEQFAELYTSNVYTLNCDVAVKIQQGRLYVLGGVFNGGTTGIESISGSTHTVGYTATAAGAVNIATTAVVGNGTTATATIATQASAPQVGSTVVVRGVTPSGFNGVFVITASSTTTISYANATNATASVQGVLGYNFGAANYGPLIVNFTQQGFLAQENSTGHVDYTAIDNSGIGADIVSSSRANTNFSTFTNNTSQGLRLRSASNWLNNSATLFGNGLNVGMYSFSQEINAEGQYTSELRQPLDLAFVTNTGPLASTAVKTYSTAIPANSFTSSISKIVIHAAGEITGTAGTKNMTVNLGGSAACGFTTAAGAIGSYSLDCIVYASSASAQSYTATLLVDGQPVQAASGSRSISMVTGSAVPITLNNTINGTGDTMSVRSVEIRQAGL